MPHGKTHELKEGHVPAAQVEKYLKGIIFPASKFALLDKAKDNEAPKAVIDVIEKFDEKEYNGVVDVAKAIGKVE